MKTYGRKEHLEEIVRVEVYTHRDTHTHTHVRCHGYSKTV